MQDENTKRSGARLTSLLTVFAVLICMLSLMILPASAASEPKSDAFYGKWTVKPDSVGVSSATDWDIEGVYFMFGDTLCNRLIYHENTGFMFYLDGSEDIFAQSSLNGNEVFDFGKTPVEIPEVLFDFFVDNFDYSPSSYVKITANGGQENYTLLDGAGSLFRMATGFISNIGQTIMDTPLLLAFIALPVVGLGVGLFKRLSGV